MKILNIDDNDLNVDWLQSLRKKKEKPESEIKND